MRDVVWCVNGNERMYRNLARYKRGLVDQRRLTDRFFSFQRLAGRRVTRGFTKKRELTDGK